MLRIDNLTLSIGSDEEALRAACARALRVNAAEISSVQLLRRSIDARDGVKLVCSAAVEVKNEAAVFKRCRNKNVQPYAPRRYAPPAPISAPSSSEMRTSSASGTRESWILRRTCSSARAARAHFPTASSTPARRMSATAIF